MPLQTITVRARFLNKTFHFCEYCNWILFNDTYVTPSLIDQDQSKTKETGPVCTAGNRNVASVSQQGAVIPVLLAQCSECANEYAS